MKAATLEVQEYVRLVAAAIRGVFTPPFYRHDIVEQLDVIGIGSLVVVLLTGFFTGAALASHSTATTFTRLRVLSTSHYSQTLLSWPRKWSR